MGKPTRLSHHPYHQSNPRRGLAHAANIAKLPGLVRRDD